jgi:hypothetical protein
MLLHALSSGDVVKLIDKGGSEWLGTVGTVDGSFLWIRSGGVYWREDGIKLGYWKFDPDDPLAERNAAWMNEKYGEGVVPRIEEATPEDLQNLVDISLLD